MINLLAKGPETGSPCAWEVLLAQVQAVAAILNGILAPHDAQVTLILHPTLSRPKVYPEDAVG